MTDAIGSRQSNQERGMFYRTNDRVYVASRREERERDYFEIKTQGTGLGPDLNKTRCKKASLRS